MRRPLIIGHRGFPARFPDNSVDGVRAALSIGADGVEVDVRLCREGRWVCHHDHNRERQPVSSWTLAELASAGVPSLADVVAVVPAGRWLYVEVKPLPLAALDRGLTELAELLVPRAPHVRLLSSSLGVLAALQEALPGLERSWVVDALPAIRPPRDVALSPKHTLVERLTGWGIPLHPWTVNRRWRIRAVLDCGVESVTTNRPELALEVRAESRPGSCDRC